MALYLEVNVLAMYRLSYNRLSLVLSEIAYDFDIIIYNPYYDIDVFTIYIFESMEAL